MHVRLMSMMLSRWIVAVTLVATAAATLAATDVQRLGPQVGHRVPDFRLTDQNGQAHTLATSMGPKGAMIVFFRSADW
jgi:cytochrome oxidase Cu insertion factor (SCO1/SenC/PrrC family)